MHNLAFYLETLLFSQEKCIKLHIKSFDKNYALVYVYFDTLTSKDLAEVVFYDVRKIYTRGKTVSFICFCWFVGERFSVRHGWKFWDFVGRVSFIVCGNGLYNFLFVLSNDCTCIYMTVIRFQQNVFWLELVLRLLLCLIMLHNVKYRGLFLFLISIWIFLS